MGNATKPLFTGESGGESHLAAAVSLPTPAPPGEVNDAAVRMQIDALRREGALPYRDRLAERLANLQEMFKEEGEDELFLADSLRALLAFLERLPSLPYPSVTLTSGGEACLTWQRGSDYFLGARFFDIEHVHFAAHYPNRREGSLIDRLSGSTTSRALADLALHFQVSDWAAK